MAKGKVLQRSWEVTERLPVGPERSLSGLGGRAIVLFWEAREDHARGPEGQRRGLSGELQARGQALVVG
eukprot:6043846-Alexandrium_andersonii.AAC.1